MGIEQIGQHSARAGLRCILVQPCLQIVGSFYLVVEARNGRPGHAQRRGVPGHGRTRLDAIQKRIVLPGLIGGKCGVIPGGRQEARSRQLRLAHAAPTRSNQQGVNSVGIRGGAGGSIQGLEG